MPGPVVASRHAGSPTGGVNAGVVPRASRGTSTVPARTANCGSSRPRAEARSPSGIPRSSMSTRVKRPGCSDWADRSIPHTGAWSRSTRSAGVTATARRVTTTSRAVGCRSWTSQSRRVRSSAVSGSAPSPGGQATATRSGDSSARTVLTPASASHAASAPSSGSATATVGPSAGVSAGTVQSSRNRSSCRAAAGASRASGAGRATIASTVATGAPAGSARSIRTASSPAGESRTRTSDAPEACRRTPRHTNGNLGRSSSGKNAPSPLACTAASSSAGCRPYAVASPASSGGRVTSATTSSPVLQAARSPWKAGP